MTNCTYILCFNKWYIKHCIMCCILQCRAIKWSKTIRRGAWILGPKEVERLENSQNFPAYYTVLCARTADAIDAIDQQRYQEARALLIAGMQEAEEIILSQEE